MGFMIASLLEPCGQRSVSKSRGGGVAWTWQCFRTSWRQVVQVDGSSHTRKWRQLRYTPEQQLAIDHQSNLQANMQGVDVGRLHVDDGDEWPPLLWAAMG